MPHGSHAGPLKHPSWELTIFRIPPHLFEYVVFWVTQSVMLLIVFFLTLHVLKKPGFQQDAVLGTLALVGVVPVALYFAARFKRYLAETKGRIWWDDLNKSFLFWGILLAILIALAGWF